MLLSLLILSLASSSCGDYAMILMIPCCSECSTLVFIIGICKMRGGFVLYPKNPFMENIQMSSICPQLSRIVWNSLDLSGFIIMVVYHKDKLLAAIGRIPHDKMQECYC